MKSYSSNPQFESFFSNKPLKRQIMRVHINNLIEQQNQQSTQMTQKKLVEAFKAFIQKSVLPLNSTNEVLLNDWKHFNNIISSDPIDTNQLDFYLYVINKQPTNSPTYNKVPPERQTTANISDFTKFSKRPNDFNLNPGHNPTSIGEKTGNSQLGDKKNTNNTNNQGSRRKNLIANMQNFQNLLAKNQQKLQNYNKTSSGSKDAAGFNVSITSNGGTKKYY